MAEDSEARTSNSSLFRLIGAILVLSPDAAVYLLPFIMGRSTHSAFSCVWERAINEVVFI